MVDSTKRWTGPETKAAGQLSAVGGWKMEMPNVKNTLIDSGSNVTYHVMAYRALTREEMLLSVRHYWSQTKKRKLKAGAVITIVSIIGHNG